MRLRFQGFHAFPQNGQLRFFALGREDSRAANPSLIKAERQPLMAQYEVRVSGLGKRATDGKAG